MHHNPRRVGISTLHYGLNEGAILQAHSLAALLKSHLGPVNVEIVDQRYPSKLAVGAAASGARAVALRKAVDDWLPLGSVRTRTDDSAVVKAALRGQYDLLVYGSDQVWFLQYQRKFHGLLGRGILPVQKSPFLPPFPNIYWPDERLPMPQVCFAAAVGPLQWRDIPSRHAAAMRRGFEACRLISVRDERTRRFLEWLAPELAQRSVAVPDPTFGEPFRAALADAPALERVQARLVELGVDFSRPRCGIVAGGHPVVREAAEELRRRGVQLIGITTRNDFCDIELFKCGFHPLDWARVFHHMDFCVLERMHACICCLLQQTPFVALDISEVPGDQDTKVRCLMRTFGLEEFCLSKTVVDAQSLRDACRSASTDTWDWNATAGTVRRLAKIQIDFLRQIGNLIPTD